MAKRNKMYGKQVFNQFFLKANYLNAEAFEAAIKERLSNPYWDIGKAEKAKVVIHRNKHGARVTAYEHY